MYLMCEYDSVVIYTIFTLGSGEVHPINKILIIVVSKQSKFTVCTACT